jgi:hypothetical protein
MLNVHLYFVKLFGCYIIEVGAPIDAQTFANAILEERFHPSVYLKFGCTRSPFGKAIVGWSDMHGALRNSDGSCAFATWFYEVDTLAINVMFSADGEKREGLVDAWHPRFGTNKVLLAEYE